jgi:hypothetical protein
MRSPRLRHFLSDTLLLAGLTLFLISMFQPFIILPYVGYPPFSGFPTLGWVDFYQAKIYTFKIDYYIASKNTYSEWLITYWYSHSVLSENGVGFYPNIGPLTFAFQILTLALAAPSVLRTRFRAALLISSLITTLSMTLLYLSMHQAPLIIRTISGLPAGWIYRYAWNLTGGYWLTYPAIVCFAISLPLSRGRRKKTNSPNARTANDSIPVRPQIPT